MLERRLAFITIVVTFCLLLWGGVVHNTGSSLACPDWPLCFGQYFPKMEGGILIEHGHRLLASFVGILTIFLTILLFRQRKQYPHIAKLSFLALVMVIIQGLLGGITVIFRLPTLVSTAHLSLSMIYFCTLILIHHHLQYRMTNEGSYNLESQVLPWKRTPKGFKRLVILCLGLVYVQIIFGAFIRHVGVGAACGLGAKSILLCLDPSSWNLTFWPSSIESRLHIVHRYLAFIISIIIFISCTKLFRHFTNLKHQISNSKIYSKFLCLSLLPIFIVVIQIGLGMATVAFSIGIKATTAHLGGAALLLISLLKLYLELTWLEKAGVQSSKKNLFIDLLDLTKPKLSALVLLTVLVGLILAPGSISPMKAILALFLIAMIIAGSCALNCYLERDVDKKMFRTRERALPAGRMNAKLAMGFGISLILLALPFLFIFVNGMTALLGLLASILYLYAYTPMKRRSPTALFIGAVPGAIPPVMGWTVVTGELDKMAYILFLILFVWQLPHFLSISIYYFQDYALAGIKLYPHIKGMRATKARIFFYTSLLLGISFLPYYLGGADQRYLWSSLVLSGAFLAVSLFGLFIGKDIEKNKLWARQYFFSSLVYLPSLLGAMIFFK